MSLIINEKFEQVSVENLKLHPRNPRQGDLSALQQSVEVNGFYGAIVAQRSTGHILAGNHRYLAAKATGLREVPVCWVDVDDVQALRILMADNRTADKATYDDALLAELLSEVQLQTGGLAGTGYDDGDLSALIDALASGNDDNGSAAIADDDDDAPDRLQELQRKWSTAPGQVWQLGDHVLVCGDSTDPRCRQAARENECTTLIYDPEWHDAPAEPQRKHTLAFSDGCRCGDVVRAYGAPTWLFVWDCVSSWWTPNRPLRRGKCCLWYGPLADYDFDGAHYGDAGEVRTVTNTRGTFEFVPDERGKHLSDVFAAPITKLHSDGSHSHSKPLDWMRLLIGCCTREAVFDPFSGSGTALIACEQLGRACHAIEIDPRYVALTLERWSDLTGQTPTLVAALDAKECE